MKKKTPGFSVFTKKKKNSEVVKSAYEYGTKNHFIRESRIIPLF